jgi:hypothetical protein
MTILRDSASNLFKVDKRLFFLTLCLLSFVVLYVKKAFIENETAAFQILEERGEMGIFHLINTFQYLTIPIWYLWKFTLIAFIIWVGSFFYGYRIHFSRIWQIVMFAELVFFAPEVIRIFWFMFMETNATVFDIRAFYPLSLMNFFDYEVLHPKYHYPLKSLNVFELMYWFILVYGIHWTAKKRLDIAYAIVFSSYVLFFILWLLFFIGVYK